MARCRYLPEWTVIIGIDAFKIVARAVPPAVLALVTVIAGFRRFHMTLE